jgi:hypothetical protein
MPVLKKTSFYQLLNIFNHDMKNIENITYHKNIMVVSKTMYAKFDQLN